MSEENANIIIQTEDSGNNSRAGCAALLLIAVFLLGLLLGCLTHSALQKRKAAKVITTTDTTFVYDTTRIVLPQETKYIKTTDTMLVRVTDTLVVRDTLYMILQKEVKEYKGEEYFAKVSGYKPSLDYIEVYPKTTIITKTERTAPDKNKVSLGVNVGYLEAFSIPIYIEYERMLHKNVGVHARVVYNLPSKNFGAEAGASVNLGW